MKERWNLRHPDVRIDATDKHGIWKSLRDHNKQSCGRESCWINQEFMANHADKGLKDHTFAPKPPESWKTNPVEWLSSTDINKSMYQVEHHHPTFEFIGPSPIDFDAKPETSGGECVWPELCNFSVQDCLDRKKTKIGMIFNLDPHYKSGSHWIAMYVDLTARHIFFFDSNGSAPPREITRFRRRIQSESPFPLKYSDNKGKRHQQQNTECGMYCITVITELVRGDITHTQLATHRIPDSAMKRNRGRYFSLV
jgi:hypothetical protein